MNQIHQPLCSFPSCPREKKRRSRRRRRSSTSPVVQPRRSSTSPVVQPRRSSTSPVVPPVDPPCTPQPCSRCPFTPRYQGRRCCSRHDGVCCTTPLSPPATSLLLVLSNLLINLPIVMLPSVFF